MFIILSLPLMHATHADELICIAAGKDHQVHAIACSLNESRKWRRQYTRDTPLVQILASCMYAYETWKWSSW